MDHWLWIILAALLFECKGEDKVIQPTGDVIAAEGDTVTLGCTYETSDTSPTLLWYKQKVKDFPKYILKRSTFGTTDNAAKFQKDRFDATINKTSVPLKISSAAVSDSAVYYCALQPTRWLHGRELFDSSCEHQTKHNSQNHSTLIQSEHSVTAFHFCQHGNTRCNFTVFSSCSLMNNVRLMASFTLLFPGQIAGDEISPEEEKVSGREGESVTLRCEYQTNNDNILLYWYRHHSDLQAPQFILWKGARSVTRENIPDNRYGSKTTRTTTELTINRLTLADSALYYCALDTQ
ncbi:hypothetical protein PAMA_004593 [Pampus argenteus]